LVTMLFLLTFGRYSDCSHLSVTFMLSSTRAEDQKIIDAAERCKSARKKNPALDKTKNGPSFCLGLLEQARKNYPEAIEAFNTAIERCTDHGLAYYNLGRIHENLLHFEESICAYRASSKIDDTRLNATIRLVPLLLRHSNASYSNEAFEICNLYLKDFPNSLPVMELLGASYHKLRKFQKALRVYEETVSVSGGLLSSMLNAASAADAAGNFKLAEEYYQQAILGKGSSDPNAWTKYGCFLKYRGRKIEAINAFRKTLELDPSEIASETSYAVVQLASLTGGLPRETMSISYIRELFNGYANKFDEDLCINLQYKGHEHIASEVKKLVEFSGEQFDEIIDIGCGTGLCGPLLRPLCKSLVGIDISEQMLFQAKNRHCYDDLELREVVEYLGDLKPLTVDAIVAADVFIYIGDLDACFAAAAKALKSGTGALVFTVEELIERLTFNLDSRRDYYLLSCGRFGHSRSYIYRLAARYGFSVKKCDEQVLRTQNGSPVKSLTVCLLKEQPHNG